MWYIQLSHFQVNMHAKCLTTKVSHQVCFQNSKTKCRFMSIVCLQNAISLKFYYYFFFQWLTSLTHKQGSQVSQVKHKMSQWLMLMTKWNWCSFGYRLAINCLQQGKWDVAVTLWRRCFHLCQKCSESCKHKSSEQFHDKKIC